MTGDYGAVNSVPSTPAWKAKLNRAAHHLADIEQQVTAYLATKPCEVIEEPVETSSFRARLVMRNPVPDELPLAIGDCVHNIRSALDALAYQIAKERHSGEWDDKLERAPAFPICNTPTDFDRFFREKQRTNFFDDSVQQAFREFQPFGADERVGRLNDVDPKEYEYDPLLRLDALWNIDKHRRIPVVVFKPGMMSWGSDGDHKRGVYARRVDDPEDIICYVYDDPATRHLVTPIDYDLQLQLADDTLDRDLVTSLKHLHGHVKDWVIPGILQMLANLDRDFPRNETR